MLVRRAKNLEGVQNSYSANLLVSILVRYPEVSTVVYQPRSRGLTFTFMLRGSIPESRFAAYEKTLLDSVEAYMLLLRRDVALPRLTFQSSLEITNLAVECSLQILDPGLMNLIIEVTREHFGDMLNIEFGDLMAEEDLYFQEEMISQMLQNVRSSYFPKNLVAFREGGRVMVYPK